MKHGKSAFPYLTLLIFLLVGIPVINHHFQKKQKIEIEMKVAEMKDFCHNSDNAVISNLPKPQAALIISANGILNKNQK